MVRGQEALTSFSSPEPIVSLSRGGLGETMGSDLWGCGDENALTPRSPLTPRASRPDKGGGGGSMGAGQGRFLVKKIY